MISYGGYQYNCKYLNNCIKPCNQRPQTINSVLVRSREAQDKQLLIQDIVSLEKKLGIKSKKCPCKESQNPGLLVNSQMAMIYMNLSARVAKMFEKVNQIADELGLLDEVQNIKINYRYQPGVRRYNLCVNLKVLKQRIKFLGL